MYVQNIQYDNMRDCKPIAAVEASAVAVVLGSSSKQTIFHTYQLHINNDSPLN